MARHHKKHGGKKGRGKKHSLKLIGSKVMAHHKGHKKA